MQRNQLRQSLLVRMIIIKMKKKEYIFRS